jgi:hypothetical protein
MPYQGIGTNPGTHSLLNICVTLSGQGFWSVASHTTMVMPVFDRARSGFEAVISDGVCVK